MTLTLNATPSATGARTVTFQPLASEESLVYLDWVQTNRRRVAELSKGRAAYLHVPDMGADGIREFIKWYYGQIDAEALVVDVRANGGGNVSRMLIERLRRQVLALGFSRTDSRREHLSGRRVPRPDGRDPERELGVGRRHLPGDVPRGEAGAAGRPPLVGRRRRHHEPRHAARRRHRQRAGVRLRHAPRANGSSRATASIPTSTSRTIRRRSSPGGIRSSSAPSPR